MEVRQSQRLLGIRKKANKDSELFMFRKIKSTVATIIFPALKGFWLTDNFIKNLFVNCKTSQKSECRFRENFSFTKDFLVQKFGINYTSLFKTGKKIIGLKIVQGSYDSRADNNIWTYIIHTEDNEFQMVNVSFPHASGMVSLLPITTISTSESGDHDEDKAFQECVVANTAPNKEDADNPEEKHSHTLSTNYPSSNTPESETMKLDNDNGIFDYIQNLVENDEGFNIIKYSEGEEESALFRSLHASVMQEVEIEQMEAYNETMVLPAANDLLFGDNTPPPTTVFINETATTNIWGDENSRTPSTIVLDDIALLNEVSANSAPSSLSTIISNEEKVAVVDVSRSIFEDDFDLIDEVISDTTTAYTSLLDRNSIIKDQGENTSTESINMTVDDGLMVAEVFSPSSTDSDVENKEETEPSRSALPTPEMTTLIIENMDDDVEDPVEMKESNEEKEKNNLPEDVDVEIMDGLQSGGANVHPVKLEDSCGNSPSNRPGRQCVDSQKQTIAALVPKDPEEIISGGGRRPLFNGHLSVESKQTMASPLAQEDVKMLLRIGNKLWNDPVNRAGVSCHTNGQSHRLELDGLNFYFSANFHCAPLRNFGENADCQIVHEEGNRVRMDQCDPSPEVEVIQID